MIKVREVAELTTEICLEDVETRFLYNLPPSELARSERLFFQIEQAWWFYVRTSFINLLIFKIPKSFLRNLGGFFCGQIRPYYSFRILEVIRNENI